MLELLKSKRCELPGIENFKQRTVYNYLLNDPQDERHVVHDIHRDMMTLFCILNESKLSPIPLGTYLKHSSTAESRYERYMFNKRKRDENYSKQKVKEGFSSQQIHVRLHQVDGTTITVTMSLKGCTKQKGDPNSRHE